MEVYGENTYASAWYAPPKLLQDVPWVVA